MNYQTKKYISMGFILGGVGVAASGVAEIVQGINEKNVSTICDGITYCTYGVAAGITAEVMRRECKEMIKHQDEQARLQGQYHRFQQDLWKRK